MKSLLSLLAMTLSLSVMGQNVMVVNGKGRVEFKGETFRPGKASSLLCSDCDQARQHFKNAQRIRTWNIILSNISFAEIVLGVINLEDNTAVGVLHASIGGGVLALIANREKRIDKEVQLGVSAFNRCRSLN